MFIVFEGIDGSGKSAQATRLAVWLRAQGHDVIETREPTTGAWGERYRSWARGELEASAEEVLAFFVEDRREHVAKLIRPALAEGAVVICDRYAHSTYAYQAAQGIDRERLRGVVSDPELPTPDLVLWLRVPVALALRRLATRDDVPAERFERRAFLEAVDREYEALGLEPIDGDGPEDEVERRVRERVRASLPGAASGA